MDFSKLTAYLDSLQETYGVPMADMKVMQHHETIYRHSYGFADYEKKIPLGPDHLFRLYSASKVITMTAVLQLIEKGLCDFDDPLSRYIPEYAHMRVADEMELIPYGNVVGERPTHPAEHEIRIIDLMTMTAGFSYDTKDPNIHALIRKQNGKASTREIIGALAKTPLMYEPGTRWNYSLAHDVLAAVVEVISGMQFSKYLKQNIFDPLGITDFYFRWENDETVRKRICDIYAGIDDRPPFVHAKDHERDQYCFTLQYESGGAGLIASVDAYSLFADALSCGGIGKNNGRILKPETVALFKKPYTVQGQLKDDFDMLDRFGYEYGLGVRVLVDGTRAKSPVGEFGWDGAAGAYVLIDTDRELSVFFAEHVLYFGDNYHVVHPKLRDLVYEAVR